MKIKNFCYFKVITNERRKMKTGVKYLQIIYLRGDVYIHYINNSQNSIVIKQPIKKLKKYLGISPKNMHTDSKYAAKKMLSVISH